MNRNEIIAATDIKVGDTIYSRRFALNGRVKDVNPTGKLVGLVGLVMANSRQDTMLLSHDNVTLTNRPE